MKNYFRILRSKLIFWILEKYTYPEVIPLLMHGSVVVCEGDVAVINGFEGNEFGKVISTAPPTVYIRLYRRPV